MSEQSFEGPAIVDLMGHQRYTGNVSEQKVAGVSMVRIDTITSTGEIEPKIFGAGAIYCITPITAEKLQAETDERRAAAKQVIMRSAVNSVWRKRPDGVDSSSLEWLGDLIGTTVDLEATKAKREQGHTALILVDGTELYHFAGEWFVEDQPF